MPLAHRVPDLGALELLLAVARLGSLGGAARRAGHHPARRQQPDPVDGDAAGVALVDRSPRGSRLTDAGALVTDWARRVVEAAEAFDAGAQALRGPARLAAAGGREHDDRGVPAAGLADRAARAAARTRRCPCTPGTRRWSRERLLARRGGPGFVEGLTVPEGLDSAVIAHDRLIVVAAPGHPWARRRAAGRPAELARDPADPPRAGVRAPAQVLDAALACGGLAEPLLELASTTAVKAAAVSGAGPAVLSELAVGEELAARRLWRSRWRGWAFTGTCGRSGRRRIGRWARRGTCSR